MMPAWSGEAGAAMELRDDMGMRSVRRTPKANVAASTNTMSGLRFTTCPFFFGKMSQISHGIMRPATRL